MSWSILYVVGKSRVGNTGVGVLHKVKEKNNPSYYYFSPKNKPKGYKEHIIFFIVFAFGEGVTIIDGIESMKLYVSDIEESYKYTIIGHLGNLATEYLLLHIVQCTILAGMCSWWRETESTYGYLLFINDV